MNHELPEAQPRALIWVDDDVLLACLCRGILLRLPSLVERATVLTVCIVPIHILLFHLVFVVQERHEEVSLLSHCFDVVSKLIPVLPSSDRLLLGVPAVFKLLILVVVLRYLVAVPMASLASSVRSLDINVRLIFDALESLHDSVSNCLTFFHLNATHDCVDLLRRVVVMSMIVHLSILVRLRILSLISIHIK